MRVSPSTAPCVWARRSPEREGSALRPSGPAPYVRCEDVFKIYKVADIEVVALRGLDLRVRRGELLALVGASGSGKSTLLNILAGLDQPSAGRVYVGERDLAALTPEELVEYRRRQVGMVWQETARNLVPYLDARENVALPLILDGKPAGVARRRAGELLELVGLAARARHRPAELSGGEQQRVAIAVALANEPSLLLADEPTGELDAIAADAVFDTFARVNRELGTTILVVTHDPDIAGRVDRVVGIRDGRTSYELIRRRPSPGSRAPTVHEEYVLVDAHGRLQLPREVLDALDIRERVRVLLGEGYIAVQPPPPDSGS
ncbi:Lipoprotein-releasing system ATP-binding protein LolD [bacterium HR29]|mgnify:CR=1 FL=1|jgi:ABC-type lipoprotein export system ATPase subunit|nr:Lipoprotein-releasing system ATP-binding protein LolD [bacterium HR29]